MAFSENNLRWEDSMCRLESLPGEMNQKHYIKIDNTNLSPEEAVARIREAFGL